MRLTNAQGKTTKLETELTQLQIQLAELQAKRRLDLDLCHVRAVGLSAEIDRLQSRFQLSALEKIRDRILLSHPPKERRKLKTVLDQFIRQCAT